MCENPVTWQEVVGDEKPALTLTVVYPRSNSSHHKTLWIKKKKKKYKHQATKPPW